MHCPLSADVDEYAVLLTEDLVALLSHIKHTKTEQQQQQQPPGLPAISSTSSQPQQQTPSSGHVPAAKTTAAEVALTQFMDHIIPNCTSASITTTELEKLLSRKVLAPTQQQQLNMPGSSRCAGGATALSSIASPQQQQGRLLGRSSSAGARMAPGPSASQQQQQQRVAPGTLRSRSDSSTQLAAAVAARIAQRSISSSNVSSLFSSSSSTAIVPSADAMLSELLGMELLARDPVVDGLYTFTIPGAGAFLRALVKGREELKKLVARKRYGGCRSVRYGYRGDRISMGDLVHVCHHE